MSVRFLASAATLVHLLAATGCGRPIAVGTAAAPVEGVAPLQAFGSEPDLMPALTFEPAAGRLQISAPHPVYVTVVEVDPATQARTVVFPELGRAPVRVAGALSLELELSRDLAPFAPAPGSGQPAPESNRGRCATTADATTTIAPECAATLRATAGGAPVRTVLVIASTDTLVVAETDASNGRRGTAAWRIPDEMPAEWAAVYVWPGARPPAP